MVAFVPTMKPLDKDKTEKAETKAEEKSVEAAPIVEEKLIFQCGDRAAVPGSGGF